LAQLIIIVAMFALLWLFLIRPQRARAQAHRELLTRVEVGNEILTVGGLYGTVLAIDEEDDDLTVEIAPGIEVRIARRAVAAVSPEEDEEDEEELPALEEGEAAAQDEEVRS
jgi:preprotein translocase subunit YajC